MPEHTGDPVDALGGLYSLYTEAPNDTLDTLLGALGDDVECYEREFAIRDRGSVCCNNYVSNVRICLASWSHGSLSSPLYLNAIG